MQKILSDTEMNIMYNASDIGINTAMGEGFGLCNIEHACRHKPQVVTKVGGLIDIFEKLSDITHVIPTSTLYINNLLDRHNGLGYLCTPEAFVEKIEYVYNNYDKCIEEYQKQIPMLLEKYNWDTILKTLDEHL